MPFPFFRNTSILVLKISFLRLGSRRSHLIRLPAENQATPVKPLSQDDNFSSSMLRRIVIVGCWVVGTTGAFLARKTDRNSEIILVGEESVAEYSRCGLPYAFSGVVESLKALVGYDQSFYESTNRIDLRLGSRATKIDPSPRTIEIRDLASGRNQDRKSTRLNSSHANISYAVFCLKKKK